MPSLLDTLSTMIDRLAKDKAEQLRAHLDDLESIYPFNTYEYIISNLLGHGAMTLDEYDAIRADYIAHNLYLNIFEISAPRGFGEQWAQGHLKELVPELTRPSKLSDESYKGQYDFFLPRQGQSA